ncbi:hypothetical protein [Methylobacterium sp. NEAU K]|uniref:hypothetical protein n=1 Tax=Methylobacterium sp. NEAU K TaxID=3064946 RepID=UPI002734D11A|nr:hypothetical protein [Methylobacterium sp. NEAU K]MDP4005073.1 hypothetical protein [Methylobacterium sp. NEAU K]
MTDNDLATSEGGESFTPEEQAAFEAYERGEDGPSTAAAAVEAPDGAPAGGEAAAPAGEAGEAAGEGAGAEIDPSLQARDEKGKFVPHGAFHEERERRKAVEKELTDLREKYARGDERLRLLTEAARAQAPAAAQPAAEPPKVPNPEEDIFGYAKHLEEKLAKLEGTVTQETTRQRQEREVAEVVRDYHADVNRFAQAEPTFADAFKYVIETRRAEYAAMGVPEAQIRQALGNDELQIAIQARQQGVSPAERIFAIAKARGFAPKAPEPPAAPAAPVESAAQKAERVAAGQAGPGKSLSAAGGAPAGEVTFETLMNMSEAEFEAFALKNPRKLDKLMGAEG